MTRPPDTPLVAALAVTPCNDMEAVNGPDDLLVRIGWPSGLRRGA